jgi:hypothetical protein
MLVGHPLGAALTAASAGRFPPGDGRAELLPPDADDRRVAVAFTGHAYVLADVDRAELAERLVAVDGAGGGHGGVHHPDVLSWLAATGGDGGWSIGTLDVVLARVGGDRSRAPALGLRLDLASHPRVSRAVGRRSDVTVVGDDDGLVTMGRGLVGRWEVSIELFDAAAGPPGTGRRLIEGALAWLPEGEPAFAQVAAGNARSLRAFLGAGFVPIGSEVVIARHEPG